MPKHFITTPKQKEKELRPKTQESCKNACSANGLISIQMCNLLPKWNAKYIKRKNMHSGGLDCLPAFLACLLACLPAATKYTCFSCKHILWHSNWNAVKSKRPPVLFDTCIKLILSQVTCGEQCSKLKKM